MQPQNGDCYQFPSLELDSCPRFAPESFPLRVKLMPLNNLV